MPILIYDHSPVTAFILSPASNYLSAGILLWFGYVVLKDGRRKTGTCWSAVAFAIGIFAFAAYFVYTSFPNEYSQEQIRSGFRINFNLFLILLTVLFYVYRRRRRDSDSSGNDGTIDSNRRGSASSRDEGEYMGGDFQ